MGIFFSLSAVLVLSFFLVWSTNLLLFNFKQISRKIRVSSFALSELVVSLITTLPELTVGIIAALKGHSMLAIGNAVGSNIANVSLIIGLAAIIGGVLVIRDRSFSEDSSFAFLAGTAPMVLLSNGVISRVEGLLLVAFWFFYQFIILRKGKKVNIGSYGLLKDKNLGREIIFIVFGVTVMFFSANKLVDIAGSLAITIGIPEFVAGILLTAVGTSLPELVFQIEAIKKNESEMALGNLIGSIVSNGALIIGVVCLISPVVVSGISEYLMVTMVFMAVFSIFFIFANSRKRLDKKEGFILVMIYLCFAAFELIMR